MVVNEKMRKSEIYDKASHLKDVSSRLRAIVDEVFKGNRTAFSKKLGAAPSVTKPWLDGETLPGGRWLARISELGFDVAWLLTGRKSEAPEEPGAFLPQIRRAHRPLDLTPPSKEITEALDMAWSVLESETSTAKALELNINEFYEKIYGAGPSKKKENGY